MTFCFRILKMLENQSKIQLYICIALYTIIVLEVKREYAEEKNLVRSHCGSIERGYGSARLCSSPYIQ